MSKIFLIREKTSKIGGAEVYLSRLSYALKEKGFEHSITNSIFPNFLPSWIRIILFNIQLCFLKKSKVYFSLERIICPDIYRAGDGVHKVFLSIRNKSKLNLLHPIYLFLEKKCFLKAKKIIANSNMVKNEIISSYDISAEKIDVIYNGIGIEEYNYSKSLSNLSKEFNICNKKHCILFVGSGYDRKGVREFLEILSRLKTDFQAIVIGKEKKISFYKTLAINLKINEKVIFVGPRNNVKDFYVISDLLLFPTHYDPFSNVVLEAMSYKNVVFTTKQNGAHEILPEGFTMQSPKDLSVVDKIENILNNSEFLKKSKEKNYLLAKKYSLEKNMTETLRTIKQVTKDIK